MTAYVRKTSFGEKTRQSFVDRLGIWLSRRAVRTAFGDVSEKSLGDFGCGFYGEFGSLFLNQVSKLYVADISLSNDLKRGGKIVAIEGYLPQSLAEIESGTIDFILMNNILEHLFNPVVILKEAYRLLPEGGRLFLNVPSWRGKLFLETAAFRFGFSPAEEMNDHKMYYDPRDLWPLIVQAGFYPQNIKIARHKFGLNTKAIVTK